MGLGYIDIEQLTSDLIKESFELLNELGISIEVNDEFIHMKF